MANAIGRCLLQLARDGRFLGSPLVVFLDEAHQFLNKTLGEETTKHSLDAFSLIVKRAEIRADHLHRYPEASRHS